MKYLFLILLTLIHFKAKAQNTDPWTVYMTPNEIHKMLQEYVGTFNVEISMWMTEAKEPTITKVISENRMLLGNRFLEMSQTGNMMGMDYHAISTIGYNTISKTYTITSLTNMGTGTLYLTGFPSTNKKEVSLTGELINPVNKKAIKVRQVIHFIDNDNMLIENFDTHEGQPEKKSIQYKITRKK